MPIILSHYDAMIDHYGDIKGVAIARKHLAWYVIGMRNANEFRAEINKVKDAATVKNMVREFFENKNDSIIFTST